MTNSNNYSNQKLDFAICFHISYSFHACFWSRKNVTVKVKFLLLKWHISTTDKQLWVSIVSVKHLRLAALCQVNHKLGEAIPVWGHTGIATIVHSYTFLPDFQKACKISMYYFPPNLKKRLLLKYWLINLFKYCNRILQIHIHQRRRTYMDLNVMCRSV